MRAYDIIVKKRDKKQLKRNEIKFFIKEFLAGNIADYQMSALLMAIYLNGMKDDETAGMVDEMLHSGTILDFSSIPAFKADKHSTGGVGDKISIPLAPLAASLGVYVPMVSGRGLGHTGGTLDKLESIPGYNVNLTIDKFKEIVGNVGCSIIGQTKELAPADKRIYAMRDVTGTVESIPLIASSIMSKKLAEGIDGLVFDVKCGSGAFMKTEEQAYLLANTLKQIGETFGKQVTAYITDMNQPLGTQIGNALEIIESIEILKGRGPSDSVELTLQFAASMLVMSGLATDESMARSKAIEKLRNGEALEKFKQMIEAHGGNPTICDDYNLLPKASKSISIISPSSGYVHEINTERLGIGVMIVGAGRERIIDKIDYGAGLTLMKKTGYRVTKGEELARLWYNNDTRIDEATNMLESSFTIKEQPLTDTPMLIKAEMKTYY